MDARTATLLGRSTAGDDIAVLAALPDAVAAVRHISALTAAPSPPT